MNNSRIAAQVGFFVIVGGALIALLILNFSKGITLGKSAYTLRVTLPNAAGLKPSADVMMAGVNIGTVKSERLSDDGRSVDVTVTILSRYKIPRDARFTIDSLGFLGDQYISVNLRSSLPPKGADEGTVLKDGDTVRGEAPFNVLEAVQSISGLVDQAKRTVQDLDQAMTNVNALALSTNNLAHFASAVSNLQVVSERAVGVAARTEDLLATNAGALHSAVVNFQTFSESLTNTAGRLDGIVATNTADLRETVTNLTVASEQFKLIAADLQAGKGPAGALLKDEELKRQLSVIVSNTVSLTAEFGKFGHNLNERGIWSMLKKPKEPETNRLSRVR